MTWPASRPFAAITCAGFFAPAPSWPSTSSFSVPVDSPSASDAVQINAKVTASRRIGLIGGSVSYGVNAPRASIVSPGARSRRDCGAAATLVSFHVLCLALRWPNANETLDATARRFVPVPHGQGIARARQRSALGRRAGGNRGALRAGTNSGQGRARQSDAERAAREP